VWLALFSRFWCARRGWDSWTAFLVPLFGLARGAAIVLLAVLLAGLTPLPREPFWRQAVLSGPFETVALALKPYLPEGVAQRLKYR